MTKVPNTFSPLSNFWQYPNMVHWHVTVFVMFVYYTCMKACMRKKKEKKNLKKNNFWAYWLLITLLHYCYMIIWLYLIQFLTINTFIFMFPYLCGLLYSAPFHVLPTNTTICRSTSSFFPSICKLLSCFYKAWIYQDTDGDRVNIHVRCSCTCMYMCVCICM